MRLRLPALLRAGLTLVACGPARIPLHDAGGLAAEDAPKLLIRLDEDNDFRGVGQHVADYLTDGSVIRLNEAGLTCLFGPSCGILESNTLTATGLAALHALLDENADLLGQPGSFDVRPKPGLGVPGGADVEYTFVIGLPDGSRHTVTAPSLRSKNADKWEADVNVTRLNALAEALIDPASLAGPDGLADQAWKPDPSTEVAVVVWFSEVDAFIAEEHMAPDIKALGWPFEGEPDSLGMSFAGADGVARRCGFASRADMAIVAERMSLVGGDRFGADL